MDVIQLNFEVGVFGGFLSNLLIPVMMLLLRLMGKRVVTVVHAVTPKKFFEGSNIEFLPDNYPHHAGIMKFGMSCAYRLINMFSNKLVVHSEIFRDWYGEYVKTDKIVIIPHGVMEGTYVDGRESLHKEDDELIVLCFGVISPRKGLDTLISAFSMVEDNNVKLIIAGKEMPYFAEYLERLKKMVIDLDEDRICFEGEVSDLYAHQLYELADIVVLPYKVSVSASGALAFAMQHANATILSETEFF
ncbi:unnamed protein product, partial [marine sediment metagenome]